MKKTFYILLIWIGACLPGVASAHGYHEFSHSVPPIVQAQILDVLGKLLEKLPPLTPPKNSNKQDAPSTLANRLLVRMDIGSATTNRLLKKEFEASPLERTFAPIGMPLFIEELVSMMDEYLEHGKAGLASFLTPDSISRIRIIESDLEKAKQ